MNDKDKIKMVQQLKTVNNNLSSCKNNKDKLKEKMKEFRLRRSNNLIKTNIIENMENVAKENKEEKNENINDFINDDEKTESTKLDINIKKKRKRNRHRKNKKEIIS